MAHSGQMCITVSRGKVQKKYLEDRMMEVTPGINMKRILKTVCEHLVITLDK